MNKDKVAHIVFDKYKGIMLIVSGIHYEVSYASEEDKNNAEKELQDINGVDILQGSANDMNGYIHRVFF